MNIEIDRSIVSERYRDYVFDPHYCEPLTLIFGGSSAGKTYATAIKVVMGTLLFEQNTLVLRQDYSNIRNTIFNDIYKVIHSFGLEKMFTFNYSPLKITCEATGYQILFKQGSDPESLKGASPQLGVVTNAVFDEASEGFYETIMQLRKRLRGKSKFPKSITLIFNPIGKENFIFQKFMKGLEFPVGKRDWQNGDDYYREKGKILIQKFTYKDNDHLTEEDIALLENESDQYFYEVYTLGYFGSMGERIFTNLEIDEHDVSAQRHGLDFGFSADPTAMMGVSNNDNYLYVCDEPIYATGLLLPQMADIIHAKVPNSPVLGDGADPLSIATLKYHGVPIMPAQKGTGSVIAGINHLKSYEKIIIHPRCVNAIPQLQNYSWKKNREGLVLPVPRDGNDHCPDAIRYAESYNMPATKGLLKKKRVMRVRSNDVRKRIVGASKFGKARF